VDYGERAMTLEENSWMHIHEFVEARGRYSE